MRHQPLLNHRLVHAAMISVDRMPYCRIHNDAAAEFYGIPDPDVSPMNISLYYQRMRVRQYIVMLQGHQFFVRNQPGEFRCKIDLKDHSGIYQPMLAIFRTVAWDQRGKAAYAVVVGAPIADLRYYMAYEILNLAGLPGRTLEAARFLFRGFSNQEIADELDVSVKTVEKDLHFIFEHTRTHSRRQLLDKFEKYQEQFTGPPQAPSGSPG
jgi:DNA-binding CsgD family transcriptional regulator